MVLEVTFQDDPYDNIHLEILAQCSISIPLEKGFRTFSEGLEMEHWPEMG